MLDIADPLIARLLGSTGARASRALAPSVTDGKNGKRRVEIELGPAESFSRVSADVERQYLQALFVACDGDLERMARELLGPRGAARQVHLRLNQLGLKLRDLRGGK